MALNRNQRANVQLARQLKGALAPGSVRNSQEKKDAQVDRLFSGKKQRVALSPGKKKAARKERAAMAAFEEAVKNAPATGRPKGVGDHPSTAAPGTPRPIRIKKSAAPTKSSPAPMSEGKAAAVKANLQRLAANGEKEKAMAAKAAKRLGIGL